MLVVLFVATQILVVIDSVLFVHFQGVSGGGILLIIQPDDHAHEYWCVIIHQCTHHTITMHHLS